MRLRMLMSILAVPLSGCFQELFAAGAELAPDTDPSSSSGFTSTGDTTPTTSGGSGVQTVTGLSSETTTWEPGTSGPEANPPPEILSFSASGGDVVEEAGAVHLELAASDDAVQVRLSLNGEPLAELAPSDFPYEYEVLSAKFNFEHTFEAVAIDGEGLESAPASVTLQVNLKPSGAEKCTFDRQDDEAAASSAITGLVYTKDAIVAVGTRDAGEGTRLAVWKLHRDTCELLPGWPRSVTEWTNLDVAKSGLSTGTSLAIDEDDNVYVAGTVLDGLEPRRYLAKMTSPMWEQLGAVGEQITGVAVAPKPQAAVFAVGWRQSGVNATPTDAAIWMYKLDGLAFPPDYIAAPFSAQEQLDEFNKLSERLRAVVFEPTTGHAVAVGEREFRGDDKVIYSRAFLVRMHPLMGRVGTPWTSPGEYFAHDSALGLGICGTQVVAGGWRRDAPQDSMPAPMWRWFSAGGAPEEIRAVPLSSAEFRGVACDRELKVVGAGVLNLGSGDARVVAAPGVEGKLITYGTGTPGADEMATASCDRRGFCAAGGFYTEDGSRHALVRVYHP
ncbi:hypothetical protein SAMN02745121_08441 [Nannocystis exedens]|uniref:Uncharacterized protein n=1 Tax=Nannocystis exedens TaxID=54 RepID=A0A1I2I4J8_9BACT|nr:hypothetical protein [Nannocystis exedens]PCC74633.1 hypothetical protein NAEX_07730 [Nannocystis exedens]SFF37202.1 hypothetical protein SAMN02745121_08441 [Nannocystis exedens]